MVLVGRRCSVGCGGGEEMVRLVDIEMDFLGSLDMVMRMVLMCV